MVEEVLSDWNIERTWSMCGLGAVGYRKFAWVLYPCRVRFPCYNGYRRAAIEPLVIRYNQRL
jgi:hypothetical protein